MLSFDCINDGILWMDGWMEGGSTSTFWKFSFACADVDVYNEFTEGAQNDRFNSLLSKVHSPSYWLYKKSYKGY